MMKVTSTAFSEGGMIPKLYTCDGKDVSPPLAWGGVPPETRSIALIADDPDAPRGTWVHWVIYNMPAETTSLPEAIPHDAEIKSGGTQGTTSFNHVGYGGPCPPGGTHRYYFKLYALDTKLSIAPPVNKEKLLAAMEGHVLASAQLMGKYSRQK